MKHILTVFVITAVIIFIASSCSKDNSVNVSQETQDNEVAGALNAAFSEAFSQIQITPSNLDGNVNATIFSPVGGKVVVTGIATVNQQSGRVNWSLNFGWWSYRINRSSETYLTYNGLMTCSGFNNQVTFNNIMKSSSISAKGKVASKDVDISCAYDITVNMALSTGKGSITGSVCGRSLNFNF